MFLKIARKQFLEYLLSLRFLVGTLLCLAVGVGSTWVRTDAYRTALGDYRMNRSMHSAEAKGYTQPYPLTYDGLSLDKKPTMLGIFYRGLEPARPPSVRVTANRDPMAEDQYEQSNLISDLFQTVDLMSFAALVMSLLALVFSYDIISGEKESGTLRVMLSFPVPRDALLLGKWIGGYAAVALPFILTCLCSLGVVVLHPGADVSSQDLAAFGLLAVSALLCTGSFYSLGLLVSTLTSRAFTSIAVLVAIWVALTVALPNLSPYIAQALVPVPTVQTVEREKWAVSEAANAERGRRMREYGQNTKDSEAVRAVVYSEMFRDCFIDIARGHEQIQAEYERAVDRQISAAVWLSRLSPAASLVYASGETADTGIREWRRFRKAVQAYRVRFLNYCEDKWIERARQDFKPITTEDYPRFHYYRPDVRDRLVAGAVDLGLLAVWGLIFLVAGYVAFLRYDVR